MNKLSSILIWLIGSGFTLPAWAAGPQGLVVETISKGNLDESGLTPGDVLISWRQTTLASNARDETQGNFDSPFQWTWLEIERSPRGPIELRGLRNGVAWTWQVKEGKWGAHPISVLQADDLKSYNATIDLLSRASEAGNLPPDLSPVIPEGLKNLGLEPWLLSQVAELQPAQAEASSHDLYRRAISIARGRPTRVMLLLGLAQKLQASDNSKLAEDAYREALQIGREEWGDCLVTASILHRLGNLEYQHANLEEAESFFSRALEIREKLAPRSLTLAASLNNLGIIAYRRGDFALARSRHLDALKIRSEIDPDSQDSATSLLNLGAVASAMKNFGEAADFYRESLRISERLQPGSLEVADCLNNLGNVFWATGDLDSAEVYHQQALAIRRIKAPQSLDYADSMNNLGLLAEARRDIETARDYYLRCLDIYERLMPDSLQSSDVLSNLGVLAVYQQDFPAALEYHEKSLKLRQRDAPGSLDESASLNNLGVLYQNWGELPKAYDYFTRAHEIKSKLIPGTLDFATSLGNLGDVAFARGNIDEAREYFSESIKIQRATAPSTIDLGRDLADYGRTFVATAEDPKALEILDASWAIIERSAPMSEEAAVVLHEIGALKLRAGDTRAALEYYTRAAAALEGQMKQLGGSGAVRGNFRARHHPIYLSAIQSLLDFGRPEEAFKVLETYRARSFLDLLAERDLKVSTELGSWIGQERRRLSIRYDNVLSEMNGKSGSDLLLQHEMETIARQRENLLEAIKRESQNAHKIAYIPPKGTEEIAKALDPGTLLLSYSVGPKGIHLFAISHDLNLRVYSISIQEDDLRAEVQAFNAAILRTVNHRPEFLREAKRLGERLFELLLRPAAVEIKKSKRLLVIPDGPLHTLPFDALVVPAECAPDFSAADAEYYYLAELRPIHFALSGTTYLEMRKESAGHRREAPLVAVFADPSYFSLSSTPPDEEENPSALSEEPHLRAALNARAKYWSRLGETRNEALTIARLNQNTELYLGAGANEEKVKSLEQTVDVVHFATHAFLDDRLPLNSGLLLSIPERGSDRENGLFQAWEIFEEFRLDAELVVLSACETGLGQEVGGEGLIGLTRAFQFAGAKAVLASLWQVSDQSTSELMIRFYRHLRDGLTKDAALQAAQIELIRQPVELTDSHGEPTSQDFTAPFHWAAFQLYGDWQ